MKDRTLQDSAVWKVLSAFFIGSVFSGLIFAWCVIRPSLQDYWFRTEEIWSFPTRKLWQFATTLFFLNLLVPCVIAHLKKWLSFPAYRLIIGGMLFAVVLVLVWLIAPLSALSQLLLFRFSLALVMSLMLLVITQRWYWGLAILMLVLSLMTPVFAAIPYAFLKSVPFEWFEISKFFASSSTLALLSGYWLVKSSALRKVP